MEILKYDNKLDSILIKRFTRRVTPPEHTGGTPPIVLLGHGRQPDAAKVVAVSAQTALDHGVDFGRIHPVNWVINIGSSVITDPAGKVAVIQPASQPIAYQRNTDEWNSSTVKVGSPMPHVILCHPAAASLKDQDVVRADV